MGRRCISGLAWRLTWRWANRAMRRSIMAPDRDTTMERRRQEAIQCRWRPLLRSRRKLSSPAFALRYAHISGSESEADSESEAVSDGGEGLETAVEGDRTWWSAGSIAVPPPEAGNNPSGSVRPDATIPARSINDGTLRRL